MSVIAAVQATVGSGGADEAMESTVRTVTYLALFAGVAIGAVVPIIPTARWSARPLSPRCTRRTRGRPRW